MNTYEFQFTCRCPNDEDAEIQYQAHIRSEQMILVERLLDFVPRMSFHEDLADAFFAKFGGRQTITAVHPLHRGRQVKITTERS